MIRLDRFAWPIFFLLLSTTPARPNAAADHVAAGSDKLKTGDFGGAESELRTAISIGTSDPQAYNLLAFICDKTNRSEEALAGYQRALALDPQFVPAHNNLGAFYLRQGKVNLAVEQFESSLKIAPHDVSAHYNVGLIYAEEGKIPAAIAAMKQASQYAPNDVSIILVLAKLQTQTDDQNGVIESAAKILDLLQQNPALPDSKRAISEMSEALATLSGSSSTSHKRLFLLAEFQFLSKEYSGVLSTLSKIAARDRDVDYYNLLGMTLAGAGRFSEARSALAQAIAMAPHRTDMLFNMGSIYQRARDNETAIKLFKRAIAEGDSSADTEFALALGYFNFGSYEEAINTCLHIVKVNPSFDQAFLLLGRSYGAIFQNDQAAGAIRKALTINPECEQCYLHLAIVYQNMGKEGDAANSLRRVISMNPANASAHFQLGKTLAKQKENAEALKELQKAIELDPKEDLAYYQLGHLLLSMGDRSRGESYLSTARTLKEERRAAAETEMSKQH